MNKSDFYKVIYHSEILKFSISDTEQINNYLKVKGYFNFGFITSWNPFGKKIKQILNYKSTLKLIDDIKNYETIPMNAKCEGYPDEKGFLIFNIDKDEIIKLQNKYRQNAIIYGSYKRIELIFNSVLFTN